MNGIPKAWGVSDLGFPEQTDGSVLLQNANFVTFVVRKLKKARTGKPQKHGTRQASIDQECVCIHTAISINVVGRKSKSL